MPQAGFDLCIGRITLATLRNPVILLPSAGNSRLRRPSDPFVPEVRRLRKTSLSEEQTIQVARLI